MKKSKNLQNSIFYHKNADDLIAKQVPQIQSDIETFAQDLAQQSRPSKVDSSVLFFPKIKSAYEVLLETVFKLIGGFALLSQTPEKISELLESEKQALLAKRDELQQKARIIRKDIKNLTDISHLINRWKYKWRFVLIALSIGEVAVNYKILLIVTPNQVTALVASLGLCTVLFIVAHSLKDILARFSTTPMKWSVGSGITCGVLLLLYNLNTIRISYMQNDGEITSELSEWSFVIINFAMWVAGAIIALLYKPLKTEISKHVQFKKVKNELSSVEVELKEIADRLIEIPKEEEARLKEADDLKHMVLHYQNVVVSHYHVGVALFKSENLFRRTDGVSPNAFLEDPPQLKTYFELDSSAHK